MVHKFAFFANHLLFLLHCFCNDFIQFKDFKTLKITGLGALAGER
jgi:hypothetical protein